MSSKKMKKSFDDEKRQDLIIEKQTRQLLINLKRGLLPYSILFLLKIRPHYSLEIQKKISSAATGFQKVEKNIIYDNLRKFERKGVLGSYLEKSNIGAKRKYYYLTEFGKRFLNEIVITKLYPIVFMFFTIMDDREGKNEIRNTFSKKELNRLKNIINEMKRT